ncbi:RDD family protein [Amycolatopsis sp. CA-230715]|uniref:RDD family protein n=1 Tax=Amycolatopsis sp. CA-230715 TaxID=2745196 RepID=UPI001C025913|nr:RDD family protein [Amycolatopsis sp. CA-230715]QWF79051.1 hypothetical protein HUW46_02455 [Amycolatopsis sp. CA-230715]
MARWTGEWLSAPGGAASAGEPPRWPGERLGLPESGVGSAATFGTRVLALLVDLVLASLVTALFRRPDFADSAAMQAYNWWAVVTWAVITVVPVTFAGFTPGMAATGIRVARLDGGALVGPVRALVRGVLTFVIVPALVRNHDGRSWLDRLTGTVVVRLR